jgi:hypothetical protein
MELKTNEDGKTIIDVLPIGDTVRLQIIAKGFQTFGQDYKIDKAEMGIEIKLKRPGEQYSVYKQHAAAVDDGQSKVTEGGDTPKDKPAADSSDPNAAKPDPNATPPAPAQPANKPQL